MLKGTEAFNSSCTVFGGGINCLSRSGSIKSDPVDGRLGARALVPRWVLTGPVSPTRCLGFTDITVGSVFARALTL